MVLAVIEILLFLLGQTLFLLFPGCSERFRRSFKRTELALIHYNIIIGSMIITLIMLTTIEEHWCPLIPLSIIFVYTLGYRPYYRLYDNIRSAFNYLLMCGATLLKFFYSGAEDNQQRDYLYPFLLEIGIFFGILFAYIIVIRDIIK